MTVWIENPFDNLPLEGYRPQRYWLMSEAFAAAGHDVTLWTSDFNHTTKKRRAIAGEPKNFVLKLIPTNPYQKNVSWARIASHRSYASRWRKLAAEAAAATPPDLLVVSLPPIGTADVALDLKRRFGTRVVVDIMDDWPGTFYRLFPSGVRPLAKLLLSPLARSAKRAYAGADVVTGVADAYKSLVDASRRRGLQAASPPPVSSYLRFYHGLVLPPRTATAARIPGRIAYVGNLGRSYDLATAIRAVAAEPRLSLDIAGKGEQEESLKRLAAELGVANRVRFLGYLADAPMRAVLATASCGLVPLAPESCVGVPYKFADYAAAGLPIVSSLGGESAALLARYRCGATYRPGDVAALVGAALSATGDARPMAEELFDAARIYRDYVDAVS